MRLKIVVGCDSRGTIGSNMRVPTGSPNTAALGKCSTNSGVAWAICPDANRKSVNSAERSFIKSTTRTLRPCIRIHDTRLWNHLPTATDTRLVKKNWPEANASGQFNVIGSVGRLFHLPPVHHFAGIKLLDDGAWCHRLNSLLYRFSGGHDVSGAPGILIIVDHK